MVDLNNNEFESRRSRFYANLKKEFRDDLISLQQIRDAFGEGFRNGSVTYTPQKYKDGIYGTLTYKEPTKKGKTKITRKNITDEREAVALAGLQGLAEKNLLGK